MRGTCTNLLEDRVSLHLLELESVIDGLHTSLSVVIVPTVALQKLHHEIRYEWSIHIGGVTLILSDAPYPHSQGEKACKPYLSQTEGVKPYNGVDTKGHYPLLGTNFKHIVYW